MLGSSEPIALYAPGVEWDVFDDGGHDSARAVVDLAAAGGRVAIELRFDSQSLDPHPDSIDERQARAEQPWRDWAAGLRLPATATREVLRSALTLRALCHAPTGLDPRGGDDVAARRRSAASATGTTATAGCATRRCPPASWSTSAPWRRPRRCCAGSTAASTAPAGTRSDCTRSTRSKGSSSARRPSSTRSPVTPGSRPVRVGNAANRQIQLDVFGPDRRPRRGRRAGARARCATPTGTSSRRWCSAVERRWHEPDHGIWEARLAPRHHVYSKVMCWLTVARALEVQALRGEPPRSRLGGAARPDPCERAPARLERRGRRVLRRLRRRGHRRLLALGRALGARLRRRPALPRDGAARSRRSCGAAPSSTATAGTTGCPGVEGGFHICTAWLVEAYLRTGRRGDAEELFQQMLETAGPTGLLPEQYDPFAERGLGNHPQAYSHLGPDPLRARARVELGRLGRRFRPQAVRRPGARSALGRRRRRSAARRFSTVRLSR